MDRDFPNADSMKQIIIGIGTGRCGTNSLAKLMNCQPDSWFSHEAYCLDWGARALETEGFDSFKFLLDRPEGVVGDISLGLTSQAKELMLAFPNIKVIVLQRDRNDLCESLMRASGGKDVRGFFQSHPPDSPWHDDYWYKKFPNFDEDSKRKATYKYITEVYTIASALYKAYPDRVFLMSMENFNNRTRIDMLLDFCGIQKDGRYYNMPHMNKFNPDDKHVWKNNEQVSVV